MIDPIRVEYKLLMENLQEFIQGKRLFFIQHGFEVVLYPPNYGVFLTYEEYHQIKGVCLRNQFTKADTIFTMIEDKINTR